jgi:hypothetical protein
LAGLSKNLRDALKYMAAHNDVTALRMQLADRVDLHRSGEDGSPELDLDREDLVDWMEGVEHLKNKTSKELYNMLGFNDEKIPFLVSELPVDTDLAALPRADDEDGDIEPSPPASTSQPFRLKWHQLVGVVKMVECALTSGPVVLMDDVGIGKTIQVLAFFAVMAYYRNFHSETKRYPGIWGAY